MYFITAIEQHLRQVKCSKLSNELDFHWRTLDAGGGGSHIRYPTCQIFSSKITVRKYQQNNFIVEAPQLDKLYKRVAALETVEKHCPREIPS